MAKRKSHFSKSDVRYWQARLFRPTYTKDGVRTVVADWAARIQYQGRRYAFDLQTPNAAAAAARARDIYLSLVAKGWNETSAAFGTKKPVLPSSHLTVGEFIQQVQSTICGRPRTVEDYCRMFRRIAADIHGLSKNDKKYDYRSAGREKWLADVNAIELRTISPQKIQQWKLEYLRMAGDSASALRSATVSVNSILRCARCLFSKKALRFVECELPRPLPFEGIELERQPSMRYRSEIDAKKLIRAARKELAKANPEQFKIFLLALFAGLRRNEIDKLEWSAIRESEGIIRLEATDYFRPKSEDSAADVEVDSEVLQNLLAYRQKESGPFVVESELEPQGSKRSVQYRCQAHFGALSKWLAKHGVQARKPLHTLRKEFGSIICERAGIFAASRALRHSDIRITCQHYVDKKRRVTLGLGALLNANRKANS